MDLNASVEELKGVGPKKAEILKKAGIRSLRDFFYNLPRDYENYQEAGTIAAARPGKIVVRGKIDPLTTRRARRRNLSITEGVIRDNTGVMRVVWFNQSYRARQFEPDKEYVFTGTYELKNGRYQLTSPAAALVADINPASGLSPVYVAHGAMRSADFRRIIGSARDKFAEIPDLLPTVKTGVRREALFRAHFPTSMKAVTWARGYLAYEELFELLLAAKLNRRENEKLRAEPVKFEAEKIRKLVSSLPFQLTGAQRLAAWEIFQDMEKDTPMNRLLQGDVGSGKTMVAAMAAWEVISSSAEFSGRESCRAEGLAESLPLGLRSPGPSPRAGAAQPRLARLRRPFEEGISVSPNEPGASSATSARQVALLAPTAILAAQHYEGLSGILGQFGVRVALLTGATKGKTALKKQIANGEVDLVIGTHALLTDDTEFLRLGLVIIDEQHRFGVEQRQKLILKSPEGLAPHLLAMTATPIPRSLQLTVFGDLDVSVLNEVPAGRRPIATKIITEVETREKLYPMMREVMERTPDARRHGEKARGQQIYWICKAIEDNPEAKQGKTSSRGSSRAGAGPSGGGGSISAQEVTSVKTRARRLQEVFPDRRVEFLHGKMKQAEKDTVMERFAAGEIDILVSTTVVEVGVDVPNATLMVIENAESYGLAQLHQLRGRVGRGASDSYCFLLTSGDARPSQRLRELEKSTDGFHLAEVDLKLRGPGEIYGALQHGALDLRIATLSDTKLIHRAQQDVEVFLKNPENMVKYKELMAGITKYQQITTLN